jgi:acetyl-CoA carboxylase biotin carboxyl carrier protein
MGKNVFQITSPISGIFYRTPSPESPPYVEVGQEVQAGDIVCLVEQMKVFTEVMCEKDGTITQILVEQEDAVGENQPLFEVEEK